MANNKLISDLHYEADEAANVLSGLAEQVIMLEDKKLTKQEQEALANVLKAMKSVRETADASWDIVLKILRKHTAFYGGKGE